MTDDRSTCTRLGPASDGLALGPRKVDYADALHFCGRCGATPSRAGVRVCGECSLGIVLTASSKLAPRRHEAFLVVNAECCIGAVSLRAEELLSAESDLVGVPVREVLRSTDPDPVDGALVIATAVAASASAAGAPEFAAFRLLRDASVQFEARVGICGSPTAGLLVLEPAAW